MSNYELDGSLSGEVKYKYDKAGRMVEEINDSPNDYFSGQQFYKYDEYGNKLEDLWKKEGMPDDRQVFSYEYDRYGNWTKVTRYEEVNKFGELQLEPMYALEHEYTYYDE